MVLQHRLLLFSETHIGVGSPVKKLQQGCYEEVHRVCILIHQEGEPAKEVHNPADGVEH